MLSGEQLCKQVIAGAWTSLDKSLKVERRFEAS